MKTPTPKTLKFFILSAKGGGTGCALRAFYIAEALKKRGHQTHFVKPIPSLPFWFDMALSTFYYFYESLFVKADVAMAIKPYPTIIPALFVQKCKGAKVVIDVDDLDYDYSHGLFKTFHKAIELPWPGWADLVTYHNPHLREPLQKVFGVPASHLVELAQGVNTTLFSRKPNGSENRPAPMGALLAKKVRPLLVFTAHLNVACDLEPVLRAFQSLLKTLPQAQLVVAGGGPDEGRFKNQARELGIAPSVHFTGYLSPRQVASCLRVADASLVYYSDIPVNKHRASMKLRESLACGCRVVATHVGEMDHWKSAVFLSKPDPQSFAQAVLSALKSKKRTQAAAILVKKWDWTNCVKNLETEILNRQDAKGSVKT